MGSDPQAINTLSLESNRQIKINFAGGDLSSDAGLLLIKEFVSKLGIDKLLGKAFKTNDSALFRYHTDQENLLQMIYMIIAGYFEDDASDELTNDPVFKSVLEKMLLHHSLRYRNSLTVWTKILLTSFLRLTECFGRKFTAFKCQRL